MSAVNLAPCLVGCAFFPPLRLRPGPQATTPVFTVTSYSTVRPADYPRARTARPRSWSALLVALRQRRLVAHLVGPPRRRLMTGSWAPPPRFRTPTRSRPRPLTFRAAAGKPVVAVIANAGCGSLTSRCSRERPALSSGRGRASRSIAMTGPLSNAYWRVESKVDLNPTPGGWINASPVSSGVPIIDVYRGVVNT